MMDLNASTSSYIFRSAKGLNKNIVTEMVRDLGNIMKATFKNGRLGRANTYGNSEMKANAIRKVKDDEKILKGFIWKPQDRPKSTEDITGVAGKPNATATSVKPPDGKKPAAATKGNGKDTQSKPTAGKPGTPAAKDAAPPKAITYDILISN